MSALQSWIARVPPERTFLSSDEGTLAYGDLVGSHRTGVDQVVVEPGASLDSIGDLMAGRGQLVLIDPRLPEGEKERRVRSAGAAVGKEAMTVAFTSGTTGPAKAVRLTEANWTAAVRASASHLSHRSTDVWLAAMPLHHVGGLSILYRTAWVGATVRWLPRFEAARVVEELRSGVTIASLVPTMLRRVLDHDLGSFSGVRAVLVGGAAIPPGLLEEAWGRGLPALPTYGMTETCAQVATLRPGSGPRYAAHPLPGVEVRIGGDGRIQLRSPQISPGHADEEDRPPGAWFATPDRGELTQDGALRVLGRADDVIVSGGENVDPARVEEIVLSHPEIEMAAAVGVAHPEWGMAVAVVYQGSVEPHVLQEWVRPRLAAFERPKQVRRMERIPVTGIGKPDRARIRALLEN